MIAAHNLKGSLRRKQRKVRFVLVTTLGIRIWIRMMGALPCDLACGWA